MSATATTTLPESLRSLALEAERRYHVFALVTGKKTRWIEAPDTELKAAQRWLLDHWLYRMPPTGLAHGFVPGRSILSNAACHVGREWVVTADLRDFFPSITSTRVAECLAPLELDDETRQAVVQLVTRRGRLPQGAPTSPHLANLVARPLDRRLAGLAREHGWTYTRYADDLAFSSPGSPADATTPHELIWIIGRIVVDEGFRLANHKTHVMSRHQRQLVTGLVVNQRLALPKPKRRLLRAMLHRLRTSGLESLDLQQVQVVHGHLAMARLVDPDGFTETCRELSRLVHETGKHPVAMATGTGTRSETPLD